MNYQNYEYRSKVIETEYDYNKLTEREMETMTKEKEREKRKEYILRLKRKHLYDNLKFEHKVIESALHNNVITYFISQKIENKKHYDSNIQILSKDGKEIFDDKTIKQKEKELHKLLNKHYNFEERMKKKYKTDVENKLNANEKIDMKH